MAGAQATVFALRFFRSVAADSLELKGTARLLSTVLAGRLVLRGILLAVGAIALPMLATGLPDASGRLLIKGRKKEMIVTPQGLNVFPEDVERALAAQPGVRDAGVVGVRVDGEERVHAVLVLNPEADVQAIVRGANATLEDHQRVWSTSIWPGEALPRT